MFCLSMFSHGPVVENRVEPEIMKNGLRRTNFEQLTLNIVERVVHSNCKQKYLTEFSLSVKRIGKTIFSNDSTSCMDFFMLFFFLQIQGVPGLPTCKTLESGEAN